MNREEPKVTMEAGGTVTAEGQLHGSGTLSVEIADASKAAVTVDYTTPDNVTVTIAASAGLSVVSHDVTLAGSAGFSPVDHRWSGEGSIKLDVSKSVAMTLQQTLSSAGPTTSLGISIKF